MRFRRLHPWNVSPRNAVLIQQRLAGRVKPNGSFKKIEVIAGADIAIDKTKNEGFAGVIVYSFPDLRVLERVTARRRLTFPYVPGLLTFREGPVLLRAFARVRNEPDVIFFDGHGLAHPRGIGIATHMGLLLDKPAVGCAKSRLTGTYEEPANRPGDWTPLLVQNRKAGIVLRSKRNAKPIFISPGYRIDFKTSLELVTKCLDGYRIPKPTREADAFVAEAKRGYFAGINRT